MQNQPDEDVRQQGDEQFRTRLEIASEAVVVLDQHGVIVLANEKARGVFGYAVGKLPGQHVGILMPSVHRNLHDRHVPELLTAPTESRTTHNIELTAIRQDGIEFPVELGLRAIETSHGVLISCVVCDMSSRKEVGDHLRNSDEQLRFIMDSMPPKIVTARPNGDVDYYNSQGLEFTGLTFDQLCGWGWVQFVHPDDVDQHVRLWRQAIESGRVFRCESRFRRHDGRSRWHASRIVPMLDSTQQIEMWVGSHTDIHDIKKTKAALSVSETRYRRLFEAAKDGILILDFDTGKVVDANPFMSGLLGYSHKDFLGCELWQIGLFGDKLANEAAVQTLQKDGYLRYEHLPLESKDGRRVEVEIVANAYAEGDHQVIQCNIRDITERSQLEKLLQDQAQELQEQHHRKDEFLAMLSHELRSPLAPIANAVQLLGLQESSENRVQQQARNIIERQVGKLKHLVDDLLEVSRITSGRVQLRREWQTVQSIVDGAVETVRSLTEQRRHVLTVTVPDESVWLHGDSARLEQVLVNLLTNAAKYTEEGGNIWLSAECLNEQCVLKVRDDGVGIALSLMPHVFDLFTQAERSLDRSLGGLGLGLALARRLTELHGGTIEAHSQPGTGSEFIVRLPLPSADELPSPKATAEKTAAGRSLRILVVDDSVDTALGASMLLAAHGHDVKSAHDGIAALELQKKFQPDVVVLDIGLPDLDGYEVARRIRQQHAEDEVVLVAVTGYGQDSDRQKSNEAGFNHHMVKPIEFNQLLTLVSAVGLRNQSS